MKKLREYLQIVFGAAVVAAGVYFFMQKAGLALGSVAGLAILLHEVVPVSVSVLSLGLNAGLLVLGFALLGREFGAKTVVSSLLIPVFMGVLEQLCPLEASLTGDQFLDMLCNLFVVGWGQSLLFSAGASSGGLDILGKILNKFLRVELGKAIAACGLAVALSAVLFYDIKTVVISVLGTYLSGIVLDHFLFGANLKRRVCILSEKQGEIVDFVLHQLHSGATVYEAKGAYTGQVREELLVIVTKQEYRKLMDFIARVDPKAFVTIYNVHEVMYQPKGGGRM